MIGQPERRWFRGTGASHAPRHPTIRKTERNRWMTGTRARLMKFEGATAGLTPWQRTNRRSRPSAGGLLGDRLDQRTARLEFRPTARRNHELGTREIGRAHA